jgi:hypothetical protein
LEYNDLKQLVNTIVGHITGKNKVKGKLVKVMGGELIELPSDRFKAAVKKAEKEAEKLGRAIEIVEYGYEDGLSESDILIRLCRRLNISDREAQGYLEKYKNSEWE